MAYLVLWIAEDGSDLFRPRQTPIRSGYLSYCHRVDEFLVQSMSGGFVVWNCGECGTIRTLTDNVWHSLPLRLVCLECIDWMEPRMVGKNYGYECGRCGVAVLLAELVPHYTELIVTG